MSVARDFILTVVKRDSIVSIVSEVKQCKGRSQRYHFKSSEIKERSESSQRIHFNSTESKNTAVSVVRYFILDIVN